MQNSKTLMKSYAIPYNKPNSNTKSADFDVRRSKDGEYEERKRYKITT